MKSIAKYLIAFAFSMILATPAVLAQPGRFGGPGGFGGRGGQSNGYLAGTVTLKPDSDDEKEQPGEGAVVIVSFEKKASNLAERREIGDGTKTDSLFAVVGQSGNFNIRNVPVGAATVKISLMGYTEMVRTLTINPGENRISVYLEPEKLQIAQAVVSAKVPPLSIVQDTIVMNASAVKFNKGEMAIDILEQMPGVESSNGGITILGEQVSNVYVDGVLLFGNSPMTALNNLPAEEVIALKSFQEYANKDPRHKISATESKQRVLDISTRSKAKFVTNGNLLVGGGYDTDTTYHKFRYTAGAEVTASSEKLQLSASFNVNNINNSGIRNRGAVFGMARGGGSADLRGLDFSVSGTKKWMSKTVKNFVLGQVNASYSYSDSYNVSESRSITEYKPQAGLFDKRTATSSSRTITESGRHSFSVGARKNIPDGDLSLNGSYSFNDGKTTSFNHKEDIYDGRLTGNGVSNIRTTNGDSYSVSLNASKGFWNILRLGFRAGAGQSTSEGFTVKRDTLLSTLTEQVLNIESPGLPSRNWNVSPSVRLELGDRQSISFNYSYRQTYNQSEQLAFDVTDPTNRFPDELQTRKMTNDNDTHSMEVSYNNALWKDGPILRASLEYSSVGLAKDESYPVNGVWESDAYDHRFNSLLPSISIGTESMLNRWNIRYSQSSGTPSLEQVRPRLDNSNRTNIVAGNPNLKQSRSHSLSLTFSTPLGNFEESTMNQNISTISVMGSFSLNHNNIANNRIFFAEEGNLNADPRTSGLGYDYMMPAGSEFHTYVNVPDGYRASLTTMFTTEVGFLRSNLTSGLSFSWDDTPQLVNNNVIRATNYSPGLNIALRSNFSRNFRFNVSGRGSYIYAINSNSDIPTKDYFQETLNVGAEINNILQKGYVSGNYSKTFTQKIDLPGINDNILDIRSGLRFGPRNNVDLSVVVHDIFNKTSGFSTSVNSLGTTYNWTHNFGRYIMFSLSYSFNSLGRRGGNAGNQGGRGNMPGGFGPGMMRGGFPGGGMPPIPMGGMGGFGGGRGIR